MDMFLSISFFAIFALFGSLNYSTVFSLTPYLNETAITIIALLLLIGATAKSANIPLHSWLPGSMEAWWKNYLYNYFILIFILFSFTWSIFNTEISLVYLFSIPIIPVIKLRDSKGKFRSPNL